MLWFAAGIFLFLSFYFSLISSSLQFTTREQIENLSFISREKKDSIEEIYIYKKDILEVFILFNSLVNISFGVILSYYFFINKYPLALLSGILCSCLMIFLLGEVLPSFFGKKNTDSILSSQAKNLCLIRRLTKPISILLRHFSFFLIGFFDPYESTLPSSQSLSALKDHLEKAYDDNLLDRKEVEFIFNIMDFPTIHAKDIMVPRTDMVFINANSSFEEIVDYINKEGFSRYPVYEEDANNIIGILHVKDLFSQSAASFDLRKILRNPHFTYFMKPLSDLFKEMQEEKKSVSFVIDEYGGLEGMISVEDILTKIVGPISENTDKCANEPICKLHNKEYIVDGSISIMEFNKIAKSNLCSKEYDTIAGYVIENIDRFPIKQESFIIDTHEFTIIECSKNRIEKIQIHLNK